MSDAVDVEQEYVHAASANSIPYALNGTLYGAAVLFLAQSVSSDTNADIGFFFCGNYIKSVSHILAWASAVLALLKLASAHLADG